MCVLLSIFHLFALSFSIGILSFFAIQAGARKVYCVEASSMSVHCQQLIKDNNLSDKMTVIAGKMEEVMCSSVTVCVCV